MCKEHENDNKFDNEIYKIFRRDNMTLIDITANEDVKIPPMNMGRLKNIIFKKLKLKKACNVFKLTVEHIRNAGEDSLNSILLLLNRIITNINVLSSPELNTSVASVIFKGKDKPLFHQKSHRLVRVTPLFARLIGEQD